MSSGDGFLSQRRNGPAAWAVNFSRALKGRGNIAAPSAKGIAGIKRYGRFEFRYGGGHQAQTIRPPMQKPMMPIRLRSTELWPCNSFTAKSRHW